MQLNWNKEPFPTLICIWANCGTFIVSWCCTKYRINMANDSVSAKLALQTHNLVVISAIICQIIHLHVTPSVYTQHNHDYSLCSCPCLWQNQLKPPRLYLAVHPHSPLLSGHVYLMLGDGLQSWCGICRVHRFISIISQTGCVTAASSFWAAAMLTSRRSHPHMTPTTHCSSTATACIL